MNSLVSVIIPTYNRAELLKEAIFSVYEQSYRPIECIVIDDGSTDNTKVICNEFTLRISSHFKFLYLFQTKSGVQVARNLGTAHANGQFVQYLDSDDLLYKNKLKDQVNYLESNHKADGVFGDINLGTLNEFRLNKLYKSSNLIEQILSLEGCIQNHSILYRKNDKFRNQFWDTSIKKCQEIDFQIQGLFQNATYDYLPTLCGLWRTHNGPRVMSSLNIIHLIEFYKKQERILSDSHYFNQDLKNKIANWYVYFYHCHKSEKFETKIILIKEIIRLNPKILFYSNIKMKVLRTIFGNNISEYIWVAYSNLSNYLKK